MFQAGLLLGNGLIDPVAAVDMIESGIHGDANGDGSLDISDLVYLVEYMFHGGEAVSVWTDCNCDGQVDVSDLVILVEYMFAGLQSGCLSE